MTPSTIFPTIYRREIHWSSGPLDPATLVTHGLAVNEANPTFLESTAHYSDNLGYYTKYDRYKVSENRSFFINEIPFQSLKELAFPRSPTDGHFLASRYGDTSKDSYFYHAQLEHRGLPTTSAVEVAKIRLLLGSDDEPNLKADIQEIKEQLQLHLAHVLENPRRWWKYMEPKPLSFNLHRLINEPIATPASQVLADATNRLQQLVHSTIDDNDDDEDNNAFLLGPNTFKGRFDLALSSIDSPRTAGPPFTHEASAGEIIFALDTRTRTLHGRFRLGIGPRATHGVFAIEVPVWTSTSARPCHVAVEIVDGTWNVTHPRGKRDGKGEEESMGGAWVIFLAPDLVVLGPAFRGGKTGVVLIGVRRAWKQDAEDFGFASKEIAQLDGMGRLDLFVSMWKGVHRQFCRAEGCKDSDREQDSYAGAATAWDEGTIQQLLREVGQ